MCKNTALKQYMDLYMHVGESMYEFKLIRPVLCPSVLLRFEGTKGQVSAQKFLGFFVCEVTDRFG